MTFWRKKYKENLQTIYHWAYFTSWGEGAKNQVTRGGGAGKGEGGEEGEGEGWGGRGRWEGLVTVWQ